MDTVKTIRLTAPDLPQPGHSAIPDFWLVQVYLHSGRCEDFRVILPMSEVLDALKHITVTESSIEIDHPAFKDQGNETQGTGQGPA